MKQFDVFENPEQVGQANVPYVVIVQSDHFASARTTVVVPLVRIASKKVIAAINPNLNIAGETLTLEPFQIAFIPTALLQRPIGSLEAHRHEIIRAIDALLSGL
jgi:toxin CcdB